MILRNRDLHQQRRRNSPDYEVKPGDLCIFGIRNGRFIEETEDGIVVEKAVKPIGSDSYDDTIILYGPVLRGFRATTDPGKYYTEKPLNRSGAAHLRPGNWLYRRGLHRGKPGLVQAAKVSIRRDMDRDSKPEGNEPIEVGWFGINFHPGGASDKIGLWSAGCQVIHGGREGSQWKRFWDTLDEFPEQRLFVYTLVNYEAVDRETA